jgi:hypothetical protein
MLPGAKLVVVDGNLALVELVPDKPLVIGPAISGAPGTLYTFAQPTAVVSTLTAGQACTCAAHILDVAGGSVDVMLTAASVPGVISAVTQIGSGPAITVAITDRDASQVWSIEDPATTPIYVDETADFNSSAAGDVDVYPATEATGDQLAIGFNAPFRKVTFTISTSGTDGTTVYKYWNGTAWTALAGVTDGTTDFTAAPGTYTVTWTMPTDWEARSINGSASLFYIVAEVGTVYTINPVLTQGRISDHGPNDFFNVQVEPVLGGSLGTATFRYSLDADAASVAANTNTWSETRTIPAGATFVVPNSGITVTFAAGTYVAGTKYTFTCTPPTFNSADLDLARDALLLVNDRWKFPVYAGMSATASAAATIASAIIGHTDDLADTFRLLRALVHTGNDTEANVLTAFDTVEDLRLGVFHSTENLQVANPIEGWRKPLMPTLYNAAAMAAKFTRGTNIGWVGLGGPPNGGRKPKVSAITFDERKAGEQLHNKKINATTTHIGKTGFYFVNGLLKSPAGSDFRYLHWGMSFDLACETAIDGMMAYVNASLRVNPDGSGTIHPLDAEQIDTRINSLLRPVVVLVVTEQGEGYFSAVEFKMDRTFEILQSKKIRGDLRTVPLANSEQVELTAGLAASLATEAAEEEAA